jgi:hypothetical protein
MLLRARGYEQVGNRDAVLTPVSELALSRERNCERLCVHRQITELREIILERPVRR